MDFNTVVWYANIISAITWILALIISIFALNKVNNIVNNITGDINQKHSWNGDIVWVNKIHK